MAAIDNGRAPGRPISPISQWLLQIESLVDKNGRLSRPYLSIVNPNLNIIIIIVIIMNNNNNSFADCNLLALLAGSSAARLSGQRRRGKANEILPITLRAATRLDSTRLGSADKIYQYCCRM